MFSMTCWIDFMILGLTHFEEIIIHYWLFRQYFAKNVVISTLRGKLWFSAK